jgi:hypothetical protein
MRMSFTSNIHSFEVNEMEPNFLLRCYRASSDIMPTQTVFVSPSTFNSRLSFDPQLQSFVWHLNLVFSSTRTPTLVFPSALSHNPLPQPSSTTLSPCLSKSLPRHRDSALNRGRPTRSRPSEVVQDATSS